MATEYPNTWTTGTPESEVMDTRSARPPLLFEYGRYKSLSGFVDMQLQGDLDHPLPLNLVGIYQSGSAETRGAQDHPSPINIVAIIIEVDEWISI